ncbi:MAG: MaoC family dehydratase N-terminal domain-containing protein [Chloroflexi bacterium]|nr:MaoC family dehydratase N-terminal domain-containing protein [Chloroflexota bacterium]
MGGEASLLPVLRRLIGYEASYVDEFEIEKGMIRRFAIAVGDSNPLYHDENFARTTEYGGIIAPPTFVFQWNHHKHSLFPPEQRQSLFQGLLRQPRLLVGSHEFQSIQPLRPGDILRSRSRITYAYEKQGKSGQLGFLVFETNYFNQKNEILGTLTATMIVLP